MIIKPNPLFSPLPASNAAVYILTGNDSFLLHYYRQAIAKQRSCENSNWTRTFHILEKSQDWFNILQAAMQPSLFAESTRIDALFEKKSLERAITTALKQYLENPNPKCILFLECPALPAKALGALAEHPALSVWTLKAPTIPDLQRYITLQLQAQHKTFEPGLPAFIAQQTQGNLRACDQAIQRLCFSYSDDRPLQISQARQQVDPEHYFSLYELKETYQRGDLKTLFNMLDYFESMEQQPLILWSFTQDIQQYVDLKQRLRHQAWPAACQALGLWRSVIPAYQKLLQRHSETHLLQLLSECQRIDKQSKSQQRIHAWDALRGLALQLTQGDIPCPA
ncbi:MAG: DNA polymerase III subunit delta [Legionellaceae bacterium]|nr:DNA polymerase III subunit delta [Legionellaceae bacterium]